MTAPVLFGRAQELLAVERLMARIPEAGGALVLRGDAGIGKTAVLGAARSQAEAAGALVLEAGGVPSEAALAFAGLQQLLRPVAEGVDRLRAPQRAAVSAALGTADAPVADPFLIALATLNLLADAADRTPLLLLVDDAHWLDRATGEVLAFVARRLGSEPIGMLVGLRDGHPSVFDDAGLAELSLGGIGAPAAVALLEATGGTLEPELQQRVLELAGGNPLALEELPGIVRTQRSNGASSNGVVPLTARLERAFAARASELPDATRALLLAAAVAGGGVLGELLRAAGALAEADVGPEALAPALAAGLVAADGIELRFRHPLVRSAISQAAGDSGRRAAHAALADGLTGQEDRRAWHRAAAAVGPDEAVASDLEAVATRAARRGAAVAAVPALERAAALSEAPERRRARLLQGAELAFELGRQDVVERLVRGAEQVDGTAEDAARLTWIRESFTDGVPGDGPRVRALVDAAEQTRRAGDVDLALKLLRGAALRSWWARTDGASRRSVMRAAERLPVDPAEPRLLAVLAVAAPIERGSVVVERIARAPSGHFADPVGAHLAGQAAHAVGDFELAARLLDSAIAQLRAQGRLALLAQALAMRTWDAIHLGQFGAARSTAAEAHRLARETGQPVWAAGAEIAEAMLAAVRGEAELVEDLVADAELVTVPNRLSAMQCVGALARGVAALGGGSHADAFQRLRRMFDPADPAHHHMDCMGGLSYLADAAAHSGNREAALEIVERLQPLAARTTAPAVRIGLLYARPILASDDVAGPLFADALAGEPARLPFLRARLQLAHGAWLRRQRRPADSRIPLRAAREAFDALGALPWGERARQELRASGETSRRRTPDAREDLSPQELQIARLAADGLSNREIGQQLYLSPRTVASHLYRLFPKLGVTSRSQLGDALRD